MNSTPGPLALDPQWRQHLVQLTPTVWIRKAVR